MKAEKLFECFIQKQVGKVKIGIMTKEYAKGYCFGYLNAKHEDGFITNIEYDYIAKMVDNTFN